MSAQIENTEKNCSGVRKTFSATTPENKFQTPNLMLFHITVITRQSQRNMKVSTCQNFLYIFFLRTAEKPGFFLCRRRIIPEKKPGFFPDKYKKLFAQVLITR
ncbi:Uncharacterized protein dnm_085830 [Desulfonema magnum]|uniref:Uncharacterized protein n=1 Tax=Desulfonema magnum TaxID=45655 RepID=A0A975GTU8_9BACT|nr:Uncharacterized protein dnm_085830 [Desulfonema magnum]